jgi:branched-chain amino acid transport system permease protein
VTLVFAGLTLGSVYALVALGYNVVFTASRSFNFAQAQLMMVGAFLAYAGRVSWRLPAVVAGLLAAAVVMVLAAFEERIAVWPVADPETQLITTLGFGAAITGAVQLIWGTQPLSVPFYGSDQPFSFLGGRLVPVDIGLFCLAIAMVAGVRLYARLTMRGVALTSMSEDEEAVRLRGVNTRMLAFLAFAVTGLLSGIMGFFIGPATYALASLGTSLALYGFVALAIGGFGSLYGGLVGGFAVGLTEQLAARYLGSDYSDLVVFALLIVVLMIRPAGLFGRVRERTV